MAIAVSQTAERSGPATSHSVTFAEAPAANQLLVVTMRIATTMALTSVAAGWTRVSGASIDDGAAVPAFSTQIFFKITGAGESATQTPATTIASTGSTTVGYHLTGAEIVAPLDQNVEGNSGTGSAGEITAPTITPTEDGEILIGVAGQSGNAGGDSIDSGFTKITDSSQTNIHGYKIQTTAAAETVTFDWAPNVRATVGIASFFSGGTAHARIITDALGITDAAAGEQAAARAATDVLGLLDAAEAGAAGQQSITDALGLADAATRQSDMTRSATDALGLTDTISVALTRTLTDAIGLLDPDSTWQQTLAGDPLSLTDSVSYEITGAQAHERTLTDPLGLLDDASAVQAAARAVEDTLGLLDEASATQASGRAVTDPLGLGDEAAAVLDLKRTIADALNLSDAAEATQTIARTLTDAADLSDTAAVVAGYARELAESLGLTDSSSYELTGGAQHERTIIDLLGLVDTAARQADQARVAEDPLAILDSAAGVQQASRTQTDPLGLVDDTIASTSTLIEVTITDALGLTDQAGHTSTHARGLTDLVGLEDVNTHLSATARQLTSVLGLADAVTIGGVAGPTKVTLSARTSRIELSGQLAAVHLSEG